MSKVVYRFVLLPVVFVILVLWLLGEEFVGFLREARDLVREAWSAFVKEWAER